MSWFTQVIEGQSIAWLLISGIVALASGFLSSWLTYRFIRRQEIMDQARWQGDIRKEVETYLGDRSAEREYVLEARKHLYKTIGPLRFQLVIACGDVSSRIRNYGAGPRYAMTMKRYYGWSTLYRLLRPIAIVELIERQIAYADFSVDKTAIALLKFKRAVYTALTDGDAILDHPNANWNNQVEHLFSDTLVTIANSFVIQDDDASGGKRAMSIYEFENFTQQSKNLYAFSPLVEILETFNIQDKPIFWARLVCFGHICNEYVRQAGSSIGFVYQPFDLKAMLSLVEDKYILTNIDEYQRAFLSLAEIGI